jgi:ornithine cyclodeaminase/alanine dehydrogenase-like protein (mu-crystallin family)
VLVIGGDDVRRLLSMRECMERMAVALTALARGEAQVPLRSLLWLPDRSGLLGMMPAHYRPARVMGLKAVSVMPGNHGTPWDAHQGGVLLFETRHGRPLALVDASAITAIRTAAVSGVATRTLARADAGDLAILGSGVQAGAHLEAMLEARPLRRVRVWSRTPANAARFAQTQAARRGIAVDVAADAQAAVAGADLVCTTTAAREPVLRGEWLARGAHVNAVGSSVSTARELDTTAIVRARLFVDRRESALAEAGDFLLAKAEGAVDDDHIVAELGDVLAGLAAGRRDGDEVTVFESLGLGVEDVVAAHAVYERAVAEGAGTAVDLDGAAR